MIAKHFCVYGFVDIVLTILVLYIIFQTVENFLWTTPLLSTAKQLNCLQTDMQTKTAETSLPKVVQLRNTYLLCNTPIIIIRRII